MRFWRSQSARRCWKRLTGSVRSTAGLRRRRGLSAVGDAVPAGDASSGDRGDRDTVESPAGDGAASNDGGAAGGASG